MLNLMKIKKIMSATHPEYWSCPRCGTTNNWGSLTCKQCKNRRPV